MSILDLSARQVIRLGTIVSCASSSMLQTMGHVEWTYCDAICCRCEMCMMQCRQPESTSPFLPHRPASKSVSEESICAQAIRLCMALSGRLVPTQALIFGLMRHGYCTRKCIVLASAMSPMSCPSENPGRYPTMRTSQPRLSAKRLAKENAAFQTSSSRPDQAADRAEFSFPVQRRLAIRFCLPIDIHRASMIMF